MALKNISQAELARRLHTTQQVISDIETFKHPNTSRKGKKRDTLENNKRYDSFTITLILKQNEKNEWIALSAWRNPPLTGTRDAKQREAWKKAQKAGFWGKMWYALKQQLGIS